MELLNILETLSTFPAECWLIPPVIIVGAVLAVGMLRRASLIAAWDRVAGRLGIGLDRSNVFNAPFIYGEYRGHKTRITLIARRDTFFRRNATRIEIDLANPEMVRFHLWRQDVLDNLIKAAGGKDVQVGDAEFDRRFVIRADEPGELRAILNDEPLRRDLLRVDLHSVQVSGSRLTAELRREERDPARAEVVLGALAALADRIDGFKAERKPEIIRT